MSTNKDHYVDNLFAGITIQTNDIDTLTSTTLLIGKDVATKIEIGDTGVLTEIQGDLDVFGSTTLTGSIDAASLTIDEVKIDDGLITYNGTTGNNQIVIPDNQADSFSIQEGSNKYITFNSSDGNEKINFIKTTKGIRSDNILKNVTISGGSYTLTLDDNTNVRLLTSVGQDVIILPNAQTLFNGWQVTIFNNVSSTTELKVNVDDGTTIEYIGTNSTKTLILSDNTTTNGVWDIKITPRASNNIIDVRKSGGTFNSIVTAINSITDASALNPYIINVGPGLYFESSIQMKSHVFVQGHGGSSTVVIPTVNTNTVFIGIRSSLLSNLTISGAIGIGGIGLLFDDCDSAAVNSSFICQDVLFQNCDTCIKQSGLSSVLGHLGLCTLLLDTIVLNLPFKTGIHIDGSDLTKGVAIASLGNIGVLAGPTVTDGIFIEGSYTAINISIATFLGVGFGTALRMENGANVTIKSVALTTWETALSIPNTGLPPNLTATGLSCSSSIVDVNILNELTTGVINGVFERSKTIINSDLITVQYQDPTTSNTIFGGDIFIGTKLSTVANVTELIGNTPMGLNAGGDVTLVDGLTLQISSGLAHLMKSAYTFTAIENLNTHSIIRVDWGDQYISVSGTDPVYVYFDNVGKLLYNSSRPSLTYACLLGRVKPDGATIQQVTSIATVDDVSSSLGGTYFLIYKEGTNYYVWYDVGGLSVDPAVHNRTGIKVNITENDTANTIATATQVAIDAISGFSVPAPASNVILITNDTAGFVPDFIDGNTGFILSVNAEGTIVTSEISKIITIAASNTLGGKYFIISSPSTTYYVWYYVVDNTVGLDPKLNFTAIKVNVNSTDTDVNVATKTASAIDAFGDFGAVASTNEVTVTNAVVGSVNDITHHGPGFTITTSTPGNGSLEFIETSRLSAHHYANNDNRRNREILGIQYISGSILSPVTAQLPKIVDIVCVAKASINDDEYFDIDSGGSAVGYRVWFKVSTGTGPPASGRTLVKIDITGDITDDDVATTLQGVMDGELDFSATVSTNTVTVTTTYFGVTADPDDAGITNITATTTQDGTGDLETSTTNGLYHYGGTRYTPDGEVLMSVVEYYRDGVGGWIHTTTTTDINNTKYDDNSGTLQDIPDGEFVKHSIYLIAGINVDDRYFLVYGQATYATELLATNADISTHPTYFNEGVSIISSIIMRKSSSSIISIIDERPKVGTAASGSGGSGTSDHGELTGLLDDDHTQYLLTNGTRNMAGTLNLDSNIIINTGTINGINILSHSDRHGPNSILDPLSCAAPTADITSTSTKTEGGSDFLARSDHTHSVDNTIMQTDNAQTITGTKTFTGLSILDSTGGQTYDFDVNDLVVSRTVALPLLASNDTFVFENHIQTLSNKILTTPVISGSIQDTNDIPLITLTTTALAVNNISIDNAATGTSPTITAIGTDVNIGINLAHKGTGAISISNTVTAQSGKIRLLEAGDNGSNHVLLSAPLVLSADLNFELPGVDGTVNQALLTDGAGTLSFGDAVAGFLRTTSTIIDVESSAAPASAGYALISTASTSATWQLQDPKRVSYTLLTNDVAASSLSYEVISQFPWNDSRHADYTTGVISIFVDVAVANRTLDVQVYDLTNTTSLGSTTGIATDGIATVSFNNPPGDALLQLRVKYVATGGDSIDPIINSAILEFADSSAVITGISYARTPINAAASPYTALINDQFIGVDCSAGTVIVNLPVINSLVGGNHQYFIADESGNALVNNITITPAIGDTINNGASFTISTNNSTVSLYSNGAANWVVF